MYRLIFLTFGIINSSMRKTLAALLYELFKNENLLMLMVPYSAINMWTI